MFNVDLPSKLIEGGAAILHDLNKNHHKAILGIKFINPLLSLVDRCGSLGSCKPQIYLLLILY